MRHLHRILSTRSLCLTLCVAAAAVGAEGPREVEYVSAADATKQPAMFYAPKSKHPVPLLVALHTWSGDYRQKAQAAYAQWCAEKGWAYIHPDFRGPNNKPQATGSELVVADIASAVAFAKRSTAVDAERVYLIGASGGGYTALLLAGRKPELWTAVSAWVPITDLRAWYFESKKASRKYFRDIALSCGGAPGASPAVDREYKNRSPVTHLKNAVGLRVDINAGIRDGHAGSVPISHSLSAFNLLAAAKDRIAAKDIEYFVQHAKVPPHLRRPLTDPSYGRKTPLFRRTSGNARVTIFDGGHELVAPAALSWLERQKKAAKPAKHKTGK